MLSSNHTDPHPRPTPLESYTPTVTTKNNDVLPPPPPHLSVTSFKNSIPQPLLFVQHHFPSNAMLKAPTRLIPNPPSSFGVQIDSHFIQDIFLKSSLPPQFCFKKKIVAILFSANLNSLLIDSLVRYFLPN